MHYSALLALVQSDTIRPRWGHDESTIAVQISPEGYQRRTPGTIWLPGTRASFTSNVHIVRYPLGVDRPHDYELDLRDPGQDVCSVIHRMKHKLLYSLAIMVSTYSFGE